MRKVFSPIRLPFGDALVSFAGMAVCYTPCVMKLDARPVKVTMTLPGYAEWSREFTAQPGQSLVAEMRPKQ